MSPAAWMGGAVLRALAFIGGAILFALFLAFIGGCGTTQIERATTGATIARIGLDATAGGIEIACAETQLDAHPDRLDPCLRAAESHQAARAAWDVWSAALLIAHSADDEETLAIALAMAQPVLRLYAEIAEMLRAFGVEAPALPPSIAGLAGGAQ